MNSLYNKDLKYNYIRNNSNGVYLTKIHSGNNLLRNSNITNIDFCTLPQVFDIQ